MKKSLVFFFFLFLFFLPIFISPAEAITGYRKVYLSPTDDSQVDYDNENSNFGRWPYFSVRSVSHDNGILGTGIGIDVTTYINSVLKFDLSSIPRNSVIIASYLKLFTYQIDTDAPCELFLSRFNGSWDERWITNANQPSSTLTEYRIWVRGKGYVRSPGEEAWNITGLVKKWYSGEYRNYGIEISNRSGIDGSLCKFYSKDETVAANQVKKPQLIVEFLPPLEFVNVSAPENQITSTAANISWSTSIPILSKVYYRKSSQTDWTTRSSNSTITSDLVALTGLTPNTRYYYRVFGKDAADRTITSPDKSFTTKKSSTAATSFASLQQLNPNLARLFGSLIGSNTTQSSGNAGSAAGGAPNQGQNSQNQNNEIKIINLEYEISQTGGVFWWTTKTEDGSEMMADSKTSGFVYVSKNGSPTKNNHEQDFGKNQAEVNHTVLLKNLEPGTTYQFLVFSEDDDHLFGTVQGSFTTLGTANPTADSETSSTNGDEGGNGQSLTNDLTTTDNNQQAEKIISPAVGVFKNQSPLNKPNWFLIILILLVVILIVLIMTKKQKTADATDKTPDLQKPPVKTSKTVEPKKGKGCLIFILIIVGFFIVSMLSSTLSMFLSPGMVPMLLEVAKEKIGQSFSIGKNQTTAKTYQEAQTSSSFAKIDGETKLTFSAVAENLWPKDAVGGLYKIEPSGKFSQLSAVTIDIKDKVVKGFALGYYHSDTQKWEYIPTIRIFGNTYKALIAHASEVGGYDFGLEGALEYEPHFRDPEIQAMWEALKKDLLWIAQQRALNRNTSTEEKLAEGKLNVLATWLLNRCAGQKTFDNQMDFFFIWHIAQLINATKVDEDLGNAMNRCIDLQITRADSRYDYMIRQRQELKNDLNIPSIMQFAWKGEIMHEGYPLVSGFGNTDWRTDWQVIARTEYHADVQYGALLNSLDPPTPEGTWGNGIVTHVLLFSLKNLKVGQTFKIRGVSIGDAPGYFRNWHEDFKWRINHPSTEPQPLPSDPNKHVLEMTGTLVQDNGKDGAVIKYGGLTKEQQAQMDAIAGMVKNSGIADFQGIPAYYQELAPAMTLNIIKGNPYNE